MKKEMNLTEIFDRAKKQLEGGNLNEGYKIGRHTFSVYYTNEQWEDFVAKMPQEAKDCFDEGKGSEMKRYTRKGHTYPPKMASYASSSRFMYKMGQSVGGFEYEKQLTTGLGGFPANLDGYLKSKHLYVEAKCHELYGYSKPKLRVGHKKLLDGIVPTLNGRLAYSAPNGDLNLSWDGKDSGHFDLKQMLCHLSGIANKVLRGEEKKVNFIYLVYRPTEELLEYVEKPSDKKRIQELYKEEKDACDPSMIKSIYGAILRYFNDVRRYGYNEAAIREMISAFEFRFCSQDDFKAVVESL